MSEKKETFKRLDDHKDRSLALPFDILTAKYAIISDSHKWDKSDADFFKGNEDIYCHALKQYLENGFKLVLNGDIEELAGSPAITVMNNYKGTFQREKNFIGAVNCIYRIYGNHDHDWKKYKMREDYLKPEYGIVPPIFPAIMLGEKIIILHGHEGDLFSDEIHGVTKWILRLFKRTFTILTGKSPRAAKNHKIREKREKYLLEWAIKNRLLLIAGHTHRPVFATDSVLLKLEQKMEDVERALIQMPNDTKLKNEFNAINENIKELMEEFEKDKEITAAGAPTSPNYFNSGSCLFKDSITAIEIENGKIRLIRWYKSNGMINKDWTYLEEDLQQIFQSI